MSLESVLNWDLSVSVTFLCATGNFFSNFNNSGYEVVCNWSRPAIAEFYFCLVYDLAILFSTSR
jgi:hypothetical protein